VIVKERLKRNQFVLSISVLFILIVIIFLTCTLNKDGVAEHRLGKVSQFLVFFPFHNQIAEYFFIEAAKKSNAEAQCSLGMFYESKGDYQLSGYWYLQSSLNGWWKCEDDFEHYDYPDESLVFTMLKKKADGHNKFAEYIVGKRYIEGKGVAKNLQEGIKYLKSAAFSGSRGAQLYLAGLYLKGDLVIANPTEADKWLSMNHNN
jgi:hypothetical protein